jgi:hypothetical protein
MLSGAVTTERRAYPRLLLRCPVRFKTERENTLAEGSSKDFSDGGLGLFTRSRLQADAHLEMWIKLSAQIKPLHILGRVAWAEKIGADLWRAGVCFDQKAFIKIVRVLINRDLN